jgi:uncharacterized protein (DUF58 family)
MLHTYRNLLDIEFSSAEAAPVFAGETAVFVFRVLSNGSNRPALTFSFDPGDTRTIDLSETEGKALKITCPARKRGLFNPGPLRITSSFPLGLFYAWSLVFHDTSCLVYPKPVSGEITKHHRDTSGQNDGNGGKTEGVDDFYDMRPYQPGDSYKHVSWKIFSRGQGLHTKRFAGKTGASAFFDYDQLTGFDGEHRLSILCGHILRARFQQQTYGLKLPGKTIEPDRGVSHQQACLRALALFGVSDSLS